jgi:hypothetical protein
VLSKAAQQYTSLPKVILVSLLYPNERSSSDNGTVATEVTLNAGKSFAIQIDGLITLTLDGSFGGNAMVIKNAYDVEIFSSDGMGAINGHGYICEEDILRPECSTCPLR